MKINLWVDDLRDPKNFRPGEDWHWSKTVTEAIRILATQDVEQCALDFDIMHAVPAKSPTIPHQVADKMSEEELRQTTHLAFTGIAAPVACAETFEPVARYIALMPSPPRVTIHTANPVGRKRMEEILAEGEKRRLEKDA